MIADQSEHNCFGNNILYLSIVYLTHNTRYTTHAVLYSTILEYYGLAYDNCINGSIKYNAINVINTIRLYRNSIISLGEYPIRSIPCIRTENKIDRTIGFHPTVCTNNLTNKSSNWKSQIQF